RTTPTARSSPHDRPCGSVAARITGESFTPPSRTYTAHRFAVDKEVRIHVPRLAATDKDLCRGKPIRPRREARRVDRRVAARVADAGAVFVLAAACAPVPIDQDVARGEHGNPRCVGTPRLVRGRIIPTPRHQDPLDFPQ